MVINQEQILLSLPVSRQSIRAQVCSEVLNASVLENLSLTPFIMRQNGFPTTKLGISLDSAALP